MHSRRNRLAQLTVMIIALATGLLIHELGHIVAAFLSGDTIADVVILSQTPHVVILGGGSDGAKAFQAAAGSGLVILVALASTLIGNGRGFVFSETLAMFGAIELVGWTGSLLFDDQSPNDAADFLQFSGLPRPLLILTCMLVAALCVWIHRTAASRQHAGISLLRSGKPRMREVSRSAAELPVTARVEEAA